MPPQTPRHFCPHGSAALSPAQAEWPRMRRRSPHAWLASRAQPGRRGAHTAPHTAPRERTRGALDTRGFGHVCFSTALPAVRTTYTTRSTEPQGFGLSPARVSRRSVMKTSASSSCGSVKISFYTDPTEANSSPLYSIPRSARLCLLSLLGADGAAFSIFACGLAEPSRGSCVPCTGGAHARAPSACDAPPPLCRRAPPD